MLTHTMMKPFHAAAARSRWAPGAGDDFRFDIAVAMRGKAFRCDKAQSHLAAHHTTARRSISFLLANDATHVYFSSRALDEDMMALSRPCAAAGRRLYLAVSQRLPAKFFLPRSPSPPPECRPAADGDT